MIEQHPFKWRHFQADLIRMSRQMVSALCARAIAISREMMLERGLHVDHTTIFRWVQAYAPEIEKRCRPHLKACNDSWKVDETYIKIKKVWMYLYRAVDSEGNTLEFLLSPTRDAQAAKRFFLKALHVPATSASQAYPIEEHIAQPTAPVISTTSVPFTANSASQALPIEEQRGQPMTLVTLSATRSAPRVINVDKNAAYPKAEASLKANGILPASVELRQVKYLNNLIEQDHRFIKRLTKPGMGFFSFRTAWRTLQGFEVMNMIRKGQLQGVKKGDVRGQVALVARLFGAVA